MKRTISLLILTAICIAGFLCANSTTGGQIPYIDIPLAFFRSSLGIILTIAVILLLAVFLYRRELKHVGSKLHRSIFAPVIDEEKRTSQLLSSKIESTEHRMSTTEQALEKFAAAIGDYATHLSSHTSAIQGLAEASQELKMSAADQNRVLAYLLQNMEDTGVLWQAPRDKQQPPVLHTPPVLDTPPVKQVPSVEKEEPAPEKRIPVVRTHKSYRKPGIFDKPMPPGCVLSRETRARKALAAQKEITNALHNLQSRLENVHDHV